MLADPTGPAPRVPLHGLRPACSSARSPLLAFLRTVSAPRVAPHGLPVPFTTAAVRFFRAPTTQERRECALTDAILSKGYRPKRGQNDFRALPSNLTMVRIVDVRFGATAEDVFRMGVGA